MDNKEKPTLLDQRTVLERIAEALGREVHRVTVWAWIKKGEFPPAHRPLGSNQLRWFESEIDEWIKAKR